MTLRFVQRCPLLLRVFPKLGGHHRPEEFPARGPLPKDEFQARPSRAQRPAEDKPYGAALTTEPATPLFYLAAQIYTWPDATLRELADLVRVRLAPLGLLCCSPFQRRH